MSISSALVHVIYKTIVMINDNNNNNGNGNDKDKYNINIVFRRCQFYQCSVNSDMYKLC